MPIGRSGAPDVFVRACRPGDNLPVAVCRRLLVHVGSAR
jgi:hypothetical protein